MATTLIPTLNKTLFLFVYSSFPKNSVGRVVALSDNGDDATFNNAATFYSQGVEFRIPASYVNTTNLPASVSLQVSVKGGAYQEVKSVLLTKSSSGSSVGSVAWTSVTDKPATFPPSSHEHTKADITDFTHEHEWNDITSKPSTFTPSAHTHPASEVTGLSKTSVGLGNVDNTSDANKPISTATQAALDDKADLVGGIVPTSQLPVFDLNNTFVVSSEAEMLSLSATAGDFAIREDFTPAHMFVLATTPASTLSNWSEVSAGGSVVSVNGATGAVTLAKADVGLGNVDNTADANKPVSTAQQTALDLKANLVSPTFTGTVGGITKAMVGLGNVTNAAQVELSGAQTIGGIKTFSSSPVVPDGSFTIAKTAGLQSAINAKADDTAVVKLTGAQTIAGVKTFSSAPVIPDASLTIAKTTGLQTALDGKSPTSHTHEASTLTVESGPLGTQHLPAGTIILVVKADDLYGAAGSWPATRPGRADQYCHFIGDTDPGAISQDHDLWTLV